MVKGVRKSNIGYVYSVMDEVQRLREDVVALAEKNRDLAKQLNVTKMELARERKRQQAIVTDQVKSWAKNKVKTTPAKCTIGIQCDLLPVQESEDDEVHELHSFSPGPQMQLTPPRRQSCSPDDPRRSLSPTIKIVRRELVLVAMNQRESTGRREKSPDDDVRMTTPSPPKSTALHAADDSDVDDGVARSLAPEFEGRRHLRRRKNDVSYVEPPLNRKIRRGDYYGLLKRPHRMSPRSLSTQPPRPRTSQQRLARVPASPPHEITVVQQRLTRPRATVSYVLPKLNSKLRQGDKFTFTTS